MSEVLKFKTKGEDHILERVSDETGEYYLEVSDYGREKWSGNKREYSWKMPINARVNLEKMPPNWNKGDVETCLLVTEPPAQYRWERDGRFEPWTNVSYFTSSNHFIYSDRSYYPPELVENLHFAQEVLGYEIDQTVWDALGIAGQGMNQVQCEA